MLSKHSLPLTIISLTILVGIFAIYFFLTHTPSPTTPPPNNTPVVDTSEMDGLEHYTNEKLGLSFSYPKDDWKIPYITDNASLDHFYREKGIGSSLVIYQLERKAIHVNSLSLLLIEVNDSFYNTGIVKEFAIPGGDVRYMGISNTLGDAEIIAYILADNGDHYLLRYEYDPDLSINQNVEDYFIDILKTFSFKTD